MAIRFYNPGSRIYEKMAFDHPTNDIKHMNTVSYFQIDAPARSFFEVPTELEIETASGPHSVAVRFADRVQKEYRSLGVVRINPNAKQPINDDDNVALDDESAQEKGKRLWKDAMLELVREHKRQCDEARNHGMTPQRARGTVKHALEELGIEDPANDVEDVLKRSSDDKRVQRLEEELAELRKQVGKGKG